MYFFTPGKLRCDMLIQSIRKLIRRSKPIQNLFVTIKAKVVALKTVPAGWTAPPSYTPAVPRLRRTFIGNYCESHVLGTMWLFP